MKFKNGEEHIIYPNQELLTDIIEAIPDHWMFISGKLCVSKPDDSVCKGNMWQICGKTFGDLIKETPAYGNSERTAVSCPELGISQEESKSCLHVEELFYRGVRLSDSLDDLLKGKKPCGVNFIQAGSLTHDTELIKIKELFLYFLRNGYDFRNFSAISGFSIKTDRKSCFKINQYEPKAINSPESCNIFVYTGFNLDKPECKIELDFNEELGGTEENIRPILDALDKRGIILPASKKD